MSAQIECPLCGTFVDVFGLDTPNSNLIWHHRGKPSEDGFLYGCPASRCTPEQAAAMRIEKILEAALKALNAPTTQEQP